MFLNGKKVQSESSSFYDVHNPATGARLASLAGPGRRTHREDAAVHGRRALRSGRELRGGLSELALHARVQPGAGDAQAGGRHTGEHGGPGQGAHRGEAIGV